MEKAIKIIRELVEVLNRNNIMISPVIAKEIVELLESIGV